jgi:hypothetical protein
MQISGVGEMKEAALMHRSAVAALVLIIMGGITIHASCSSNDTGGSSSNATAPGGTPCQTDVDCATNDVCRVGQCVNSRCTVIVVPDGPAPGTTIGAEDCVFDRCSNGQRTTTQADDSQAPDDFNDCTITHCDSKSKKWQTTNAAAGTPCGTAGTCDKSGRCAGCTTPADCGTDDFCHARTCNKSICGITVPHAGVALPDDQQQPGDCLRIVCDGKGGSKTENDDKDVPVADDPCTMNTCKDGMPNSGLADVGTDCGNGKVCSKEGKCVECATDDQCTAPDTCGGLRPNKGGCNPEMKAVSCSGRCGDHVP